MAPPRRHRHSARLPQVAVAYASSAVPCIGVRTPMHCVDLHTTRCCVARWLSGGQQVGLGSSEKPTSRDRSVCLLTFDRRSLDPDTRLGQTRRTNLVSHASFPIHLVPARGFHFHFRRNSLLTVGKARVVSFRIITVQASTSRRQRQRHVPRITPLLLCAEQGPLQLDR
jgi:hypothetical protein